jgi:hypothetical protein
LYFGSANLWKTIDGGITWKEISPNFTREKWEPSPSVGKYMASAQTPQLAAI